jgi:UDP-glucose 4-epimerase
MSATAQASRASGVLVTGGSGYIGHLLVGELAARRGRFSHVVSADVREVPSSKRIDGVEYLALDVRDAAAVDAAIARHGVDTVVHLASIVTPAPGMARDFMYDVDVRGTRHVLDACARHGLRKLVVTSSGAAYGYHADNPDWITEDWPLRGNEAFAYSHHKRLVEEMLARWRTEHPELKQVVFRIGTILGATVKNQITDLFDKPRLIAIRGSASPFVFVWDEDVVGALLQAIAGDRCGVFNLAADGALTIHEIAARLGKRRVVLPAGLLQWALRLLKPLGLTQYGPEQVDFLRYRPVLDNSRLKTGFGYTPRLTSAQVFDLYRRSHGRGAA